jgi:hypothetical protein
MNNLQVLIVARPGDEHGDRIEHAIRFQTNSVARLSLNILRSLELMWTPGEALNVRTETDSFSIGHTSTIWWRRPGWVEIDDLAEDEGELIEAEVRSMFEGMLIATKPRWVDHPNVVHLAENKLYQLAIAREALLPMPNSQITSSVDGARTFASGKQVIAKTISTGEGLAPFADEISTELLERVVHAPVLLQERVDALADLRVVTVGERAFVWSRSRSNGQAIDWRQVDPEGRDFVPASSHAVEKLAVRAADALGLTHSSQDWVLTREGPVFLEANPGGQWLFLKGSEQSVIPALVAHLRGRDAASTRK